MFTNEFKILFLCEVKVSHDAAEAYRNIRLTFGKDSIDERGVR